MQYRYQKPLQEIYDEYKEKYNKTGEKPYPDKLLALLLLKEKDKYNPGHLVNGEFYNLYKKEIDAKIEQVINDFEITKEEIIGYIEQKGILYREERYEHDKIWFIFVNGFAVVIGTQRWDPSYTPEKAYEKAFVENYKEKTNTRKRTLSRYKEQLRLKKIRSKNGCKYN